MSKREALLLVLIAALGAIVATYTIRSIDWFVPQIPAIAIAVVAALTWLVEQAAAFPQESGSRIGGATLILVLFSLRFDTEPLLILLSRAIVRLAARRLPPRDQDRYREEWLAELALRDERPVSGLALAAGILFASLRISRSL